MFAFKILSDLEATNSKLEKAKILSKNVYCTELADILNATFNYSRRFYMKKWKSDDYFLQLQSEEQALKVLIDTTPSEDVLDRGSYQARLEAVQERLKNRATHKQFLLLLSDLENRRITGNLATEATEEFFNRCDAEQIKWYSRVLQQDLNIGVSIDTAIKCGFNIPKFEVQLATDGHKCKKLDKLLENGCRASKKLDGYRCIAVINNGAISLYSRNGTEYENFPSIKAILAKKFPNGQFVLDGEIMSDNFSSMQQSAFASKRNTTVGDVVYHVFDYVPYEEWTSTIFKTKAFDRYDMLAGCFKLLSDTENIKQVEHHTVQSLTDIKKLEQQFIADGFEGVMINPNIPYYKGKPANSMLKFKTMLSMDCKVIDFYAGEANTKYAESLGGLVVEQENGITCKVGSGFPDDERDEIFKNSDNVIGRILEVKYQELTDDKRMRFPVKFRWRTDKDII